MKDSPFNRIVQAIDAHRLLKVVDERGARIIEPYLIFESSGGDMLLHGWQRTGAGERPSPKWCNLHFDDMISVELMPGRFAEPHRDYNPRAPKFHRVIYEIDPRIPREKRPQEPKPSRVDRPRRGPPKANGRRGAARLSEAHSRFRRG